MKSRTILLLPALLVGALAVAQQNEDVSPAPVDGTQASEVESVDGDTADATPDSEAPEATTEDPLAEVEAQERRQIEATMERFDPSEEISEDRSVAFPNDI